MDNQTKPKISVIVPVFSAEKHLSDCIDSLLNQTYENIEIILVDDGSTDNSGKICDNYLALDKRITVVHKENGGVSSARNAGLSIAKGEWIGFVDADDKVDSDMYEYLFDAATQIDADFVQCAMFFEKGKEAYPVCNPKSDIVINGYEELSELFFRYLSGGVCSKLFKTSLIKELKYDEAITVGEDMRFNLDALVRSKRAVLKTEPKYHYIQRQNSATNAVPTEEKITSYLSMLEKARKDFATYPAISDFITVETVKTAMDVCSKAVRFGFDEIFFKTREILIKNKEGVRKSSLLTKKEKFKVALISCAPSAYKRVIKSVKRDRV